MSQPVKCEICGKEVKNLGSHMYQAHSQSQQVKFITDKEFTTTLFQIRDILKRYRYSIETTMKEQCGTEEQVQLLITIPLK